MDGMIVFKSSFKALFAALPKKTIENDFFEENPSKNPREDKRN